MAKGGGGGGRKKGRDKDKGEKAKPYPDAPNNFIEKLPGNITDYVDFIINSRDGALRINIEGDKKTDPEKGEGEYLLEHSGISINENLKGVVFIAPSENAIRQEKEKLIDDIYESKKGLETTSIPGILMNRIKNKETQLQKIISYEKSETKNATRAISAGLGHIVGSYIHKSQVDKIKSSLTYMEYE